MVTLLFYLSSGLFLGWSLGANDAANVFGTAVGSKMVRFRVAAAICSAALIIGAVVGGAGASHTLGKLGAISAMPGAFTVALSAALSVFFMTKTGLPVSTSQAIVGGIIGWNIYARLTTDPEVFRKIALTWVLCPVLSAVFSVLLYFLVKILVSRLNIHILRLDIYTRSALIIAGAFGSYSLGANNIANVMGVFIPSSPFEDLILSGGIVFSGVQQLFLLGGVSIAVGVISYSRKVMETVGTGIFPLSPITAVVVVMASSLVLFVFASQELHDAMVSAGLPAFPLVPVSSSQAVVGAVMGIGLVKGGRNLKYGSLGRIGIGWIATPLISAMICYLSLFFMENVFNAVVA